MALSMTRRRVVPALLSANERKRETNPAEIGAAALSLEAAATGLSFVTVARREIDRASSTFPPEELHSTR